MNVLNRREFISLSKSALAGAALLPLIPTQNAQASTSDSDHLKGTCWLDVSAPFIVEDAARGIHSELVLTADNFVGRSGYLDRQDITEHEIYLYDSKGNALGDGGVAARLSVPALQTAVIPIAQLVGTEKRFVGGLKVRLRPQTREPMHAGNLFSSAFIRWSSPVSFDNVHANPDPLEWFAPRSFFYSMPFPAQSNYDSIFGIFNPYDSPSRGKLTIYDPLGATLKELALDLPNHSSCFYDLAAGRFVDAETDLFSRRAKPDRPIGADGGTVAVINDDNSVKNFGYLLIKGKKRESFSIDHPIHQSPYNPLPSERPIDERGRLKAKNVLYTPLAFNSKSFGGVTLSTKFHLSSGAPVEEYLWMSPFITDSAGEVVWAVNSESDLPSSFSKKQVNKGVIRLGQCQSCILDSATLKLPDEFAGSFSLAVRSFANHTLMKVEVIVPEWDAHAFTHFRPGIASARAYQKPTQRGGIVTDYITTGAHLERNGAKVVRDEIIAVMNIDDKGAIGHPTLEVFSRNGLESRIPLTTVPAMGCAHFVLSEIFSVSNKSDLTLRLVDDAAALLMSIVHIDHRRRDIALDHGSDRFSTFQEFDCDV